MFVELDVGSDNNSNETQIRGVLYSVVKEGTIASYDTSVVGFQFRRLGEGTSVIAICALMLLVILSDIGNLFYIWDVNISSLYILIEMVCFC